MPIPATLIARNAKAGVTVPLPVATFWIEFASGPQAPPRSREKPC